MIQQCASSHPKAQASCVIIMWLFAWHWGLAFAVSVYLSQSLSVEMARISTMM